MNLGLRQGEESSVVVLQDEKPVGSFVESAMLFAVLSLQTGVCSEAGICFHAGVCAQIHMCV